MPYFPAEHPLKEEEYPLAAHLGAALIQWNATEWTIRELLVVMCLNFDLSNIKSSPWTMVVELGSRQLTDAIDSYARQILKGEELECTLHVTKWQALLLSYRNYYAHGIISIRPLKPDRTGAISSMSAKGKFKTFSEDVTIAQLRALIDSTEALRRYIFALQLCLIDTRHHPHVAKPLPDRPPLPSPLVKSVPPPPPWLIKPSPSTP